MRPVSPEASFLVALSVAACGGSTVAPASAADAPSGPMPLASSIPSRSGATNAGTRDREALAAGDAPPSGSEGLRAGDAHQGGSAGLTGGDAPWSSGIPRACSGPSGAVCVPPGDFVEWICQRPHQDEALRLFAPEVPFSRLYLRGRLDELRGGEEVIVLRVHAPRTGGIVVGSNTGTYDVLRWDGTCSRGVESEGFTRARPAHVTTARIQWHRISPRAQDALIAASVAVKDAHAKRGKECRGAMTGDVSAACVKADAALGAAVVTAVESGAQLPDSDDRSDAAP